jgi:hypothetical protein
VSRRLVIGRLVKSERGVYEPALREEDVLGVCRQLLELNGARVFRAVERVPKCYRCGLWLGSSERGTPDLSGYFHKKGIIPFWIEVKRPKGPKRAAQSIRIEQIRSDGGIAFFVDGVDCMCDEFKKYGISLRVS